MRRLIDADKLFDAMEETEWYNNADRDEIAERLIMDAPTIEIIRCRECKWFDSGKNDSEIWSMCTRHFGKYIDVNADDFCSYGSRSEKPNNSKERSSE